MANRWGNSGNSERLYFLGLQIHCRWWLQPWNQKTLAPWKKSYEKPRLHFKKQRHYFANKVWQSTLPTLVKAMVFPVVTYGCESWTLKKAERQRVDAFELWCWRRLLKVLGLQGDQTSQSWKKSVLDVHWEDWCWSWSSNIWVTWCKELIHWKSPYCWKRLKTEGEGDDRGWNGWMASLTQWTWVWASSGCWFWRGKPGVLQSMQSQSWETELNYIQPPHIL